MDTTALIESIVDFKDEKQIDRETLVAILEDVFRSALVRKYGTDENFDLIINVAKGDIEIIRNRIIVPDDQIEDPSLQIGLSEAQKIESDYEIGEEVSQEIGLDDLGRRVVHFIGQSLKTKVLEHDNTNAYKKFHDLIGEIYSAEVHHIRQREIILIDDGNELILPRDKQIPKEYFRKGDEVRGVIESVELRTNKPRIILSRTSPKFLIKLFELEIPEVLDGLISIRKAVRIPGEKAKVAVETYDDRIDPVGACVGMKGSRIHGIVRELCNENIDVINFTNNLHLYITRALNPAKINQLKIDEETKTVEVILDAQEVSKAIGKRGANIKLAGQLTGYEIEVYRDGVEEDVMLNEFSDEIDEWVIDEFRKVGLDTARSVMELSFEELCQRTDLEDETVTEVLQILKEELEK
ncbi:MAG: transcription termination factor NusA [Flavobacteriaceae bacterium]|nr:transcription termination factor NusA [Flavobacteriaceae bacterium]MCY4217056.1 transcription termination factor NusA [Flavobacteriaceae bacterium]MCY4253646.1 transcription termination factor NusA [Flavobacteriaceae bacterium]